MITVLLVAAVLHQGQDAPKQIEYSHKESGFSFTRPADWTYARMNKYVERFLFTVDGQNTAFLDISNLQYSGEPEAWSMGQAQVAKDLGYTVDRQWQEEIDGVPMLLSQVSYSEDGRDVIAESGIIYADTPRMLTFKLVAPKTVFSGADYIWRNVLQSLKTLNGLAPRAFDRSKGPSATQVGAPTMSVIEGKKQVQIKPVFGESSQESSAGGNKVILKFDKSWTAEKSGDSFKFTNKDVDGPVVVQSLSMIDSLPPGRYLLQSSGKALDKFTKVTKREEPVPFKNKAGQTSTYVLREGMAGDAYLVSVDAVGQPDGNEYWTVSWSSSDKKSGRKQANKVLDLARCLSIEKAP